MDKDKTTTEEPKGALQQSLTRPGVKVRADRARQIASAAKLRYRRKLEDLHLSLREARDRQESIIDMSPDNSLSIISANEFDPNDFVSQNAELAKTIFQTEEAITVLSKDFERLFGEKPNIVV